MRTRARVGYGDLNRVMVIRSGSNLDRPPPGVPITESIGDEAPGQKLAFDNNERAGEPVVRGLIAHWTTYRTHIPGQN